MKRIILVSMLVLYGLMTFSQSTVLKKISVYKKFTCGEKSTFTFTISDPSAISIAKIVINGTDYNYDNDGDYTDFRIGVNDNNLIDIKTPYSEGMPGNGSYGDISYQIKQYLRQGENTILLQNTEDEGQVDYVYINTVTILVDYGTSNSSVSNYSSSSGSAIEINKQDIWKNFKCGFSQTYTFNLSNPSEYKNTKLLVNGTDYDYDKDGDWTDFRVTVNGSVLLDIASLSTVGFGKDGPYANAEFDIQSYLVSGTNTVILENTENEGQVDYDWINRIIIKGEKSTSSSNTSNSTSSSSSAIEINKQDIWKNFKCGFSQTYTFNLSNPSEYKNTKLLVNGTDYDYDKDGDWTDFRVTVNGSVLLDIASLSTVGFGKDGPYANAEFDIQSYLVSGTNTVILENTENEGQVDYDWINRIIIKGEKSTGSSNSTASNLSGNEINKQDIWKKFTCGFSQTYTFYLSNPSDYRNTKLLINGTDYNYDKDADWTDFRVTVNGAVLLDVASLTTVGLGKDGPYDNAVFDIQSNLISGTNTVILENTENEGQVDYDWINRIIITGDKNSGSSSNNTSLVNNTSSVSKVLPPATLIINQTSLLNESFTAQKTKTLTVYVEGVNSLNTVELVLNGSDYDFDNDGDFTEFKINVNGTDIISSKELKAEGMTVGGTFGNLVYNIKNYIKNGSNVITLENTELDGQVDYAFIKSATVRTSGGNLKSSSKNDVERPSSK